jgi:hypothetical protein
VLFQEGLSDDRLYVPLEGQVEIIKAPGGYIFIFNSDLMSSKSQSWHRELGHPF